MSLFADPLSVLVNPQDFVDVMKFIFHKMVHFPVTKLLFSLLSIRYDEELVIPIIENTPEERDLKVSRT